MRQIVRTLTVESTSCQYNNNKCTLSASIPAFQTAHRTVSDRRKRNRKSPWRTSLLHSDNDKQRFLQPRTFRVYFLLFTFRQSRNDAQRDGVKVADLPLPFSSIHSWSYFFAIVSNLLLPMSNEYFLLVFIFPLSFSLMNDWIMR